jgi:Bacterial Ig domain
LVLLVGGSIAFASQTLDHGRGAEVVVATAPPPPPPTLLAPSVEITRADTIDIVALGPMNLRRDQQYVVRLYVNDAQVRDVDLPGQQQFTIHNVPLDEGANSIRASLVGGGGEGQQSAAVTITRDDIAPDIRVLQPSGKVYTETDTLVGKTESGADIEVTDGAGHDLEASLQPDGRFSVDLSLTIGDNWLTLRSTDAAGNKSTSRVSIVRAPSAASLDLEVTPTDLFTADLPATVELTVNVLDELGHPVDGADVTFSVSPPDRETTTYHATTTDGRARFSNLTIDPGDATGAWLVTALAVLPSGIELRGDGSFSLQEGAPRSPGQH